MISLRVAVFCWMARLQKILVVDNLKKRYHILVNGCPLCLAEEESPNHLLIHFTFSTKVWTDILSRFRLSWVMLQSMFRPKVLWNQSLFVECWKIWLERNNRIFNSKSRSVSKVVNSIVWSASMWASRDKVFTNVSMLDLNLSWKAYFQGGSTRMYVPPFL